jgi:hypothetical protein
MARRSGALAALVFALALSASFAWPAGAAADWGSYNVYSGFLDLGGQPHIFGAPQRDGGALYFCRQP